MEIFHFHVFFSFRYSILDFRSTLDDDDYCDSSLLKIKFFIIRHYSKFLLLSIYFRKVQL